MFSVYLNHQQRVVSQPGVVLLSKDLAAISADNAQLRSGLHSVMVGLDEIQRRLWGMCALCCSMQFSTHI